MWLLFRLERAHISLIRNIFILFLIRQRRYFSHWWNIDSYSLKSDFSIVSFDQLTTVWITLSFIFTLAVQPEPPLRVGGAETCLGLPTFRGLAVFAYILYSKVLYKITIRYVWLVLFFNLSHWYSCDVGLVSYRYWSYSKNTTGRDLEIA